MLRASYCGAWLTVAAAISCAEPRRGRLRNVRLSTLLQTQIFKRGRRMPLRFPSEGRSLNSRGFSNPRCLCPKGQNQSERLTLAAIAHVNSMRGIGSLRRVAPLRDRPTDGAAMVL